FTSLVMPGWSATIASLEPTRRLNRLDLPTLGRPTIATLAKARPHRHAAAVGPVARRHHAPTRRLHAREAHRPRARGDHHPAGAGCEDRAGLSLAGIEAGVWGHGRDLDALVPVTEGGARPRAHPPEPVVDSPRALVPADVPILRFEQWRVRRQAVVLRRERQ